MVRDKIDMHILQEKAVLSSIKLDHLASLSDHFGLLQHADYKLPKFEFGYTTDDNCRGLLVVSKFYSISPDPLAKKLAQRYLAFLRWVQKENGQFHNEVSIDRRFLDVVGSERLSMSNLLGFISYFEYRYSCRLQISYKGDAGKISSYSIFLLFASPGSFFNFWVKRAFPAKRNHLSPI